MSIVLTGGNQTVFPQPFVAPIVETSATWGEGGPTWTVNPELTFVRCELHAGSSGVDSCELVRKYGYTLNPAARDTDFVLRAGENLMGTWVRVSVMGQQLPQVVFVGRIDGTPRNLTGDNNTASGEQRFIPSGGMRMLEKLTISESWFYDDDADTLVKVGWVPPMNKRDKRGLLVGNRSTYVDEYEVFNYGADGDSTNLWTHTQYAQYLLTSFVEQDDGPTWTIGGQTSILDSLTTTIEFGQAGSALDILRQLIPVKYGVDFYVTPLQDGFEVTVFALSAQSFSFGGATIPANPNSFSIDKSSQTDLIEVKIVQSNEKAVDTIEVTGKRIIVCGSLLGARSMGEMPNIPTDGDPYDQGPRTLAPGWDDDLEFYYQTANGAADSTTSDPGDNDAIRKQESYRNVYQLLVAPSDWNLDSNTWAVACKDDGTITTSTEYQTLIRSTLSWIPLREGFDYTTNPPTDNSADDVEKDVKPLMAWVLDEQRLITTDSSEGAAGESDDEPGPPQYPPYVLCEKADIHVSAPLLEWGVFLHPSINHVLGLNSFQQNWNGANTPDVSLEDPEFDWTTAACTIAIESDHRVRVAYTVPANLNAGDGSKLTINDEEAELWVLLAGTIVDTDDDGFFVFTPSQMVLRNDVSRLGLVLCGAISRYTTQRGRCEAHWNGLLPWTYLIGTILAVVQQGDNATPIGAPITSIILDAEPTEGTGEVKQPTTIVKTGYA